MVGCHLYKDQKYTILTLLLEVRIMLTLGVTVTGTIYITLCKQI